MTNQDLIAYYSNLLLAQYQSDQGAQTVTCVADSSNSLRGTYFTVYDGAAGARSLFWMYVGGAGTAPTVPGATNYQVSFATNASSSSVASAVAAAMVGVTVSGSTIAMTNSAANPFLTASDYNTGFTFSKNRAVQTIQALAATIAMGQIPSAVMNGFQIGISAANPDNFGAVGDQLDLIGKYVGVKLTGYGLYQQPIVLDDADLTSLIQLAIAVNNYGSSLYDIDNFLNTYFSSEVIAFDTLNMGMSYFVSSSVGTSNLVQMFITQGLLPKPMGVELSSVISLSQLAYFALASYTDYSIVSGVPVFDINAWSAATTYSKNQDVYYQGVVYNALSNGNLNNIPSPISAYWGPTQYPMTTYVVAANYSYSTAYQYSTVYQSAQNSNTDNLPTNTAYWTKVATAPTGVAPWSAASTYATGNTVTYLGGWNWLSYSDAIFL